MPWTRPPWTWPSTMSGLMIVPMSSTQTYLRIVVAPVSVSTSIAHRCVPCGKEKLSGSKVASASMLGSTPSGRLWPVHVASAISAMLDALVGALDAEAAGRELEVVDARLEQVRREDLGLLDDLVGGADDGLGADDERARAVGVHALGRDLGVAMEHLDVLERDAEPVGDDLAPRRLVALAVRRDARDDLDLAGREHADAGALPAAGAVVERAEDAGRREAAHLGERRDADAELDRVVALAAALLLGAQLVVAEELLGLGRRGLVVARVVGHARDGRERELVVRDPVLLAHLERVAAELGGELVHHPLDGEGRLGATGAAVGVDPRLVRQQRRAR